MNRKRLTNDEFIKRLVIKNQYYISGDLEINGEYVNNKTPIKCTCHIHNYTWNAYPSVLVGGGGCKFCAAAAAKGLYPGVNDLWTVRPDVAKLLKNPDDGYRYTQNSHQKTNFICPDCGFERNKVIRDVCNDGFGCPKCSDGVSYPNKFGRALLDQLPITNYECEYSPCWSGNYHYDNYFQYDGQDYILEMDGFLHYNESSLCKESLAERQAIDVIKNNLAIEHGIEVIRINCIKPEREYIRSSIMSSELNNIFDLSNIDWLLCDRKAQCSLVIQACELYMSGVKVLQDIGDILHLSRATIRKYLKRGADIGWCNYTVTNGRKQAHLSCMKPVVVVDENNDIIHVFESLTMCSVEMSQIYNISFANSNIGVACKTHKPYKGFNFRFANETIQN